MTGTKRDLINYRLERAKDTLDDAKILAGKGKWNSAINRLYYSAYYAVIALLLNSDFKTTTHNAVPLGEPNHFFQSTLLKPRDFQKKSEKCIPSCLHGDKKGTMLTCLILPKRK